MTQSNATTYTPQSRRPSTGEPTVTISVSVPLRVAAWIATTAQERNASKSLIAVEALERAIADEQKGQAA